MEFRNLWRLVFAVAGLSAVALAAYGQRPVREDRQVQQAFRTMYDEVAANWVILDTEKGSDLYLGSPPRDLEIARGYCVRDLLRLVRDDSGSIASLGEQIFEAVSNPRPMALQVFAFIAEGQNCSAPELRFLRLTSIDQGRPTVQFLDLTRELHQRNWVNKSSRFLITYEDTVAERCLDGAQQIDILDATEREVRTAETVYRVRWGVCSSEGSQFLVVMDVEVPVGALSASRIFASSLSKAEADCIAFECLQQSPR